VPAGVSVRTITNGWWGVQHELLPRVSADVAYFRRSYENLTVTDNLAIAPTDFDPYCITGPTDPRPPGGGGEQICGLYDLNPSKVGQTNNLVTSAKNYGDFRQIYNGVDVSLNARLSSVLFFAGGLSVGTYTTNNVVTQGPGVQSLSTSRCFVVDSPQEMRYWTSRCHD
jgi:hypothetical protein